MVRLIGMVAIACALTGLTGLAIAHEDDDKQAAPEAGSDSGLYLNGYAITEKSPRSEYVTFGEAVAGAQASQRLPRRHGRVRGRGC